MATTPELVAMLRELLDDEAMPYLWHTSYLVKAISQGEEQACRRAYLLIDQDTASVCNISLVVSQASYALHSKILQVRRVYVGSNDVPLTQYVRDEIDREVPGWRSAYGTPEAYIIETKGEITFYPTPQSADVASMHVARLPLASLRFVASSAPEIPEMHHEDLLLWGQHRAYMRNDSETQNMDLASFYETQFTARFGPIPSANEERMRKSLPRFLKAKPREFGT